MFCKKCGSPLNENDQFCIQCGAPVNDVANQNLEVMDNNVSQVSNSTTNEFVQGFNNQVQQPINNVNNLNNNSFNQMPNNQNGWMNGYNSQPVYNEPKKNNNMIYIIIGIAVAVVLFLGIILVSAFGKSDNDYSGVDNSGSNTTGTNVSKQSTYTAKFSGFTFKIPTDLVYEIDTDSLVISDEAGTWATYILAIEGSYNSLLANKSLIQGNLQNSGYIASNAVEKTIGGKSFITTEVTKSGINAIIGYTKANSMNVFGITAFNVSNDFDYNILETLASILNTAEYTGNTNNMSVFEKVDMSTISGLAQ